MNDWVIRIRIASLCAALGMSALLGPAPPALASDEVTLADVIQNGGGDESAGGNEGKEEKPLDELDRGTPRSSVHGYLTAANEGDYEAAARYLEIPRLPARVRMSPEELARAFKVVLDRKLWVDLDALSDDPAGREQDGLPSNRELVGWIELDEGRTVDLLLQRVTEGDVPIWKFAPATVAKIPELYEQFGYGVLESYLPAIFFDFSFAGIPVVEWVGLLAAAAVAFVLGALITGIITWILSRRESEVFRQISRFATGPLRLALSVLLFSAVRRMLQLTIFARAVLSGLEGALFIVAVSWTAMRLLDVVGAMVTRRLHLRGQGSAVGFIAPARKILKVVIVGLTVVAMLSSFGFDVTALVAGLGVGGIAFALAAQKTIENMFGGVTLFADQPVRVGDFCRFGDKIGTVEAIGMYSTRVRTLDRTVITIPNSEFSTLQLENFTSRDKIWYRPKIGVRYETTPEQIRYILVAVREMLYAHPKVDPDPARIRFVGFGAFSLDLEIFAYVNVTDYGQYLEVAEDLNLRIMDIVAEAGSSFAFPSQTTYLEQGEGLDREAGKRAEQRVAEWRDKDELYIPAFTPDRINQLRDSLDYPPEGSPFTPRRRQSAPATD